MIKMADLFIIGGGAESVNCFEKSFQICFCILRGVRGGWGNFVLPRDASSALQKHWTECYPCWLGLPHRPIYHRFSAVGRHGRRGDVVVYCREIWSADTWASWCRGDVVVSKHVADELYIFFILLNNFMPNAVEHESTTLIGHGLEPPTMPPPPPHSTHTNFF